MYRTNNEQYLTYNIRLVYDNKHSHTIIMKGVDLITIKLLLQIHDRHVVNVKVACVAH